MSDSLGCLFFARKLCAGVVLTVAILQLTACATRPSASVLEPSDGRGGATQITLFAATNRTKDDKGEGFSSGRSNGLVFEKYAVSIPPTHKASQIEWPKGKPDARRDFVVTDRQVLERNQFMLAAGKPSPDGSVGIFVHGYNTSYQEGLFRLAQIAADAKTSATPVLFSWPSEAALTGYVADRDAVLFSRDALVATITAMARSPGVKRVVLFGHSMGALLIMEALRQIRLEGHDDILRMLAVVLAAPDIDADLFRSQLQVIGPMPIPLTLFVSTDDKALRASSFLGGERARAGGLNVNDPDVRDTVRKYRIRMIDITSMQADDRLGHDRYAGLASMGPQLASLEKQKGVTPKDFGAFVFDTTANVVASPFRLVGTVLSGR